MISGKEIWVNGAYVPVSHTKGYRGKTGYRIELFGDYYYLEYGTMIVKWDDKGTWFITLKDHHGTQTIRGLCGDFNHDPMGKLKLLFHDIH